MSKAGWARGADTGQTSIHRDLHPCCPAYLMAALLNCFMGRLGVEKRDLAGKRKVLL